MGSHLCERLADRGQEVTILDNLSSGMRCNVHHSKSVDRIRLIVGDCKEPKDVRRAVSRADVIYHFAANPEVRLELADSSTCFRENAYATHVLLEAIKNIDVDLTVFASTVYGDAKITPTPEIYSPLEPISFYGLRNSLQKH